MRGGIAPSHRGDLSGGIMGSQVPPRVPPGNLYILHKKSCIFVHICLMFVIAILVHRNTWQSGKILGMGHWLCCFQPNYWGNMSPPRDFGAYGELLWAAARTLKSRRDSRRVVAVLREITGAAAAAAGLTLISSPGSFAGCRPANCFCRPAAGNWEVGRRVTPSPRPGLSWTVVLVVVARAAASVFPAAAVCTQFFLTTLGTASQTCIKSSNRLQPSPQVSSPSPAVKTPSPYIAVCTSSKKSKQCKWMYAVL